MLDIIFILTFGRLQASGTLDFPDKLYPIWKWAVGAGVLYAVIMTLISYVFLLILLSLQLVTDCRRVICLVRTLFQTAARHH